MTYKSILDQILDDSQGENYGLRKSASFDESPDPMADILNTAKKAGRGAPADWRGKGTEAVAGQGILAETTMRVAGDTGAKNIEKIHLTASQVTAKISDLFHMGFTPDRVASEMEKLSDLHAWDRQLSADTIKDMSGVVGMAYLEPNHFNTCNDTYDKIKSSGKLNALSVKRIAACNSCSKCVGKSHCALFKLPIVASKQDLLDVMEPKMASLGKKASKQDLVDLHNNKVATKATTPGNHDSGSVGGFAHVAKAEDKIVTPAQVAKMASTTTFFDIYNSLLPQYGKTATTKAMKGYLDRLKKAQVQVDVNLIDCKMLKGKLAATNAVVGSSKCAGCTLRCDMHCGYTGGTLVSFPGMANLKSNKRAHAGAKEGGQVLAEYELDSFSHVANTHGDIDVSGYKFSEDIETHGPLDLE